MSNNNATAIAYTKGGATGVSFVDDSAYPDIDVNAEGMKGSGRLSVGPDGHARHQSFDIQRTNIGSEFNDRRSQAANILDTARAPHGGRAGNLNSQTVVMVGGMETSLGAAEQLGLVRRNSAGEYIETSQGQQQSAPQQHQEQPNDPNWHSDDAGSDYMPPLPPAALEEVNSLIADLPQSAFDNTLNHVLTQGIDSVNHRELGRMMGTDEATAKATVAYIANMYQNTAAIAVKSVTPDGLEALQWASEKNPRGYQDSMRRFIHGGETKGLKELAGQYIKNTAPEDSSLRAAGFEVRNERGERQVRVQGVWTSVVAAVKAGWI